MHRASTMRTAYASAVLTAALIAVPVSTRGQAGANCTTSGGTDHPEGPVSRNETWSAAASPHRLPFHRLDFLGRHTLTIEAGAVVCATSSYSGLYFGDSARLVVRGFTGSPVRFKPMDGVGRWGGIMLIGPADSSEIVEAIIEHADVGVTADWQQPVILDGVQILQSLYGGANIQVAGSRVSNSTIDGTLTAGEGFRGLFIQKTLVEHTTVRNAAGMGIVLQGPGVRLHDVVIEGSGAIGLDDMSRGDGAVLVEASDVVITGGATYPVRMHPDNFAVLAPGEAEQARFRGNTRDTLVVYGPLHRTLAFGSKLPFRADDQIRVDDGGVLQLLPGAHVAFTNRGSLATINGGQLIARGAAGNPVVLTRTGPSDGTWGGITMSQQPPATSWLTNALVEYAAYAVEAAGPAVIDSVRVRQAGARAFEVTIGSQRLHHIVVDTTQSTSEAAIRLGGGGAVLEDVVVRGAAGVGVFLRQNGATIRGCEVTGSGGHGVERAGGATTLSVNDCNLVANGGNGIQNDEPGLVVDGRWNWWGDRAGPLGPNGDGVSAGVLYEPWLVQPVDPGSPQRIVVYAVVTPDSLRLARAGDTATLAAQLYEGSTPVSGAVAWTTRDAKIATVNAAGLVTAVATGTTYAVATVVGGAPDSARVTVPPKANERPIAKIFTPPDTSIIAGDSLRFTGAGLDPDGRIVNWGWDFGRGKVAFGPEPGWVVFDSIGDYTVALVVVDDSGSISLPTTVQVIVRANRGPVIALVAPTGDTTVFVGDTVRFAATAQDPDGDPITLRWTFGDATSPAGSAAETTWVFRQAGRVVVTVTGADIRGTESAASKAIVVTGRGTDLDLRSPGSRGRVDGHDVVFVIRARLTQDLRGDVNGDGKVDDEDVRLVLAAFGRTAPPSTGSTPP